MYTATLITPGRGSFCIGYIDASSMRDAQQKVVAFLERVGVFKHEIGQQVSDHSSVSFWGHEIVLSPLKNLEDIGKLGDIFFSNK